MRIIDFKLAKKLAEKAKIHSSHVYIMEDMTCEQTLMFEEYHDEYKVGDLVEFADVEEYEVSWNKFVFAPYYEDVTEWLRITYHIDIIVLINEERGDYCVAVYKDKVRKTLKVAYGTKNDGYFEAMKDGIEYVLYKLI